MLFDRLCVLRIRAEERGDVASDDAPANLVDRLLGDLLGWRRHAPRRREEEFDFAAREAEAEWAPSTTIDSEQEAGTASVGQDSSCQVPNVGQDSSCQVASVGQDSSCQAARQDKSCPTS
jgi:hypothetical protein